MPSYDIFFFGALFFLVGVLLSSFGAGFWILILVFTAAAVFLFFGIWLKTRRFFWLSGLVLIVILGALYYTWDDLRFRENINVVFDKKSSFSGVIISNPTLKISSQEFKLKLDSPLRGNVLVKTSRYPEFSYGDEVKIGGKIEKPFSESYAAYLAKERISGVISFAEVEKLYQEFMIRTKLLYTLYLKQVFSFDEVGKLINDYYKNPVEVLNKYGIS